MTIETENDQRIAENLVDFCFKCEEPQCPSNFFLNVVTLFTQF